MSDQPQSPLFDPEGFLADAAVTLSESPIARPARVGFLAGMLATWTLGPGVQPKAGQKDRLLEIARRAIAEAEALNQPKGDPK